MEKRTEKSARIKAEITAFLSIVFVLVVSFIFGILSISVIKTSKNMSRLAADRAIFSVFGEYQKNLLEDYHVFALESTYGSGDYDEEWITGRMHYYGSDASGQEISSIQYLTDNSAQAFREQVLAYMEQKYGIGLIREYVSMPAEWKEEEIQGEEMKEKEERILEEYEEIRSASSSGDGTPETGELPAEIQEEDPFTCIEKIDSEGILSMVLPENMELSGRSIRPDEQVSCRELRTGRGEVPARQETGGIEEKLLFHEYILDHFDHAVSGRETEQGTDGSAASVQEQEKKRTLAYETEYILSGKSSDKENLEAVLTKIFLIRMALNYAYLLSDSEKQAEVSVLSTVTATVLLMPEMAEALKYLILLVWAAGESIVDIRSLLSGNKAALIKSKENWQLPLHSLLLLGTGADQTDGEDVSDGISYQDYLRAFLFLTDPDTVTMRTLDRIEENLHTEHELDFFRSDQCVTKIQIENTVSLFGDLTYRFPVYFGYL